MRDLRRSARGLLAAAALVVIVSAILRPGLAEPAAASTSSATIQLPYLGSDSVGVPKGATVTACPRGASPDLVSLTCDDGQITFTATDFARGVGTQRVTVAFTSAGRSSTKTYRVSLEAPELTLPATIRYRYPLPQGTPTTVPYNTFRYVCASCTTASPQFRAGSVSPRAAGTVRFSGTGVVFSPAPDFSGRASLRLRLRDRYGDQTATSTVRVNVVPGRSHAPTTRPVAAASATRTVTGDATARDIGEKRYPAILSSCGTPLHGRVVCHRDGSFVYTADAGFTGYDEFGTHVYVTKTGDQAVGAVVVRTGLAEPSLAAGAESPLQAAVTAPASASKTPILSPIRPKADS
ncbi:Ig-like domain-containing protein [Frondihabitans australicus]|uniref:Ig-like domain-containing protein n=1 Tax=Frondihabitans australicus TaxID=386892 RepID=UPI000EB34110|nr:Ig-like domain-containing protein [Frondihabitans australicus]